MADEGGGFSIWLEKLPELTGLASANGPFFFGVFLVIVSLFVGLGRENKPMGIFYAVSGIVFMGLATFTFIEAVDDEKIYPYRITLTNLPQNAEIHLPLTAPRMYRDNISTSAVGSSVQVAILSDTKLQRSSRFAVHLLTPIRDDEGNDTAHKQSIGKLALPFSGKAFSIYNLTQVDQPDSLIEEDGDASAIPQFKFIEEDLQNTSLGPSVFDALGSAIVGSAFADDSGAAPSVAGTYASPITPLVVYYQKSADGNAIVDVLQSTQTESVVKTSDLEEGSNAIWIGKEVPVEIIDDIARGILEKQIPLKSISYFENSDSKTNIIQIGTSQRSLQNELLTESMVAEFIEKHHARQTEEQKQQEAIVEKAKQVEENINRTLRQLKY